ncbi:MAG: prolyl oligopeptidase family serine peptidase [Verrucomicrobiota bacterium]
MTISAADGDSHLWLEEIEGERALNWVREQNKTTLQELQSDPRYAVFEEEAIELLTSKERIPYGSIRDGWVYNFWQDEVHVRGLWRRAKLESYQTENPEWEVLIDFDELAEAEGRNWVFKGVSVKEIESGGGYVCLVRISDGGKDAVTVREFDIEKREFVEDGFFLPEAKQYTAWIDENHLMVATDFGPNTLTESGYPFVVKSWKRGTPLSEARELIRGQPQDVLVRPFGIEMDDGSVLACASEADTFFTSQDWWFPDGEEEAVQWPLPPKSSFGSHFRDWMFVTLEQDWQPEGQGETFVNGDLVAFRLSEFLETRELPPVHLVFRPNARQAVNWVSVAKGAALLSINDNVTTKILRLEPTEVEDGRVTWEMEELDLPENGRAGIAFARRTEPLVFLTYENFLTPDSLLLYDSGTNRIDTLKSLPEKFDPEGLVVEQRFAESKDGTEVPYFVVRRNDVAFDGSIPTLLNGYGGFAIPLLPGYRSTTGKLWLENGGAFVLANIRGGGEFGPAWHQAGLKTDRQRIYDDFIAVAEDLIDSGLTSPSHLGIIGGSNGGLLMGVMLNQRPDLWKAAVVQVPLLDMLRYHLLLAGASWVDEYGSPDDPEERSFLEGISPYHNFRPDEQEYPVPFFVTSTKDDRVHPGHARKMAKLFEDAELPFYYYENIDGGHSAAANQLERARRTALEFTYLAKLLFPEEQSSSD